MNENSQSPNNSQSSFRSQGDQARVDQTELKQMERTPRISYVRAPMNRTAYRSNNRRY